MKIGPAIVHYMLCLCGLIRIQDRVFVSQINVLNNAGESSSLLTGNLNKTDFNKNRFFLVRSSTNILHLFETSEFF